MSLVTFFKKITLLVLLCGTTVSVRPAGSAARSGVVSAAAALQAARATRMQALKNGFEGWRAAAARLTPEVLQELRIAAPTVSEAAVTNALRDARGARNFLQEAVRTAEERAATAARHIRDIEGTVAQGVRTPQHDLLKLVSEEAQAAINFNQNLLAEIPEALESSAVTRKIPKDINNFLEEVVRKNENLRRIQVGGTALKPTGQSESKTSEEIARFFAQQGSAVEVVKAAEAAEREAARVAGELQAARQEQGALADAIKDLTGQKTQLAEQLAQLEQQAGAGAARTVAQEQIFRQLADQVALKERELQALAQKSKEQAAQVLQRTFRHKQAIQNLEKLQRQITERTVRIAELGAQEAGIGTRITQQEGLARAAEERIAHLARQEAETVARQQATRQALEDLQVQESNLRQIVSRTAEQEARLATTQAEIAQQEGLLRQATEELAQRRGNITQAQRDLESLLARQAGIEAQIAAGRQAVGDLGTARTAAEEALRAAEAAHAQRTAELTRQSEAAAQRLTQVEVAARAGEQRVDTIRRAAELAAREHTGVQAELAQARQELQASRRMSAEAQEGAARRAEELRVLEREAAERHMRIESEVRQAETRLAEIRQAESRAIAEQQSLRDLIAREQSLRAAAEARARELQNRVNELLARKAPEAQIKEVVNTAAENALRDQLRSVQEQLEKALAREPEIKTVTQEIEKVISQPAGPSVGKKRSRGRRTRVSRARRSPRRTRGR